MGQKDLGANGSLKDLYEKLIKPEPFTYDELITNANQVAGHTGFYSLYKQPNVCLKPFNIECVRGRREHLFYQLIEYFNRNKPTTSPNESNHHNHSNVDQHHHHHHHQKNSAAVNLASGDANQPLYYRDLALLTHPIPATECNCQVDSSLFQSLAPFVARFHHPKRLYDVSSGPSEHPFADDSDMTSYLNSVYSASLKCPCYGNNPQKKSSCSTEYKKIDFFCLDDLTVHCRQPCIVDIKIGQITYDPMAIKEKVAEQSNKYKMLKEFGFRILGMKLVNETKDKNFGKTLDTIDQVLQALHGFFLPLQNARYRYAVIEQVVTRLRCLYEWFESENINQLKFFSSSILIVYDCALQQQQQLQQQQDDDEIILAKLIGSVRVKMIDFAHVFHVHLKELNNDRDNNYMFGLRKLEQMLMVLLSEYERDKSGVCLEENPP